MYMSLENNWASVADCKIFTLTGAASFVTAPLTVPLLDSILMSNVTRTKRMPHPTEFFLDMEKYYYILLALTIVGYSVCCTVIVATDTIYLALLQHTCVALYASWLFYSTPSIAVSGIYTILPTNKTYTAKFLYRIEHVLDIDKYFELLMLHGFISVFYIVSVVIAVDTTFTLYTQHICALFECLRYNIDRIRGSDFVLLEPNIKDDEAYRNIIGCIKSYQHALKFSDVLSSNYATSFLFLLGNVIISLSFGAAELLMVNNQLEEFVKLLAVTLGQLLHIYFLSLISQRLIDHSSGLQNVIYSCDWYKISRRSKQLLRFTLLRTTKPCQITVDLKSIFIVLHDAYVTTSIVTEVFASTGIASFVTTPLTIPLVERILMSNVTRSKRMPHPTEFFLDMEKYYYILLAITFVGYAVCGMIVIATDTIYFALLQHTCGTLAILSI
ncbi:PREDICTED: uncharacterized protein LOC108758113 [Trachymyrmex cornetzi]|uniref:uncharacterized protein LOC108758113 n=1 Tax=Trachymyrmex cornetzi TaxID=471704 RepID=UPI00084F495F|nr:PREDICTED: uncharacterized protein LOC108758113 [Trachymyrmex cornetzi]